MITRKFFAILRKAFFLELSERCFLSSQVRVTNSLPKVIENFCEILRKTPKLLFPFKKVVDIHPTTFVEVNSDTAVFQGIFLNLMLRITLYDFFSSLFLLYFYFVLLILKAKIYLNNQDFC